MLSVVSLLLLALAVSLDGFGVGVMYGLRRIRIPLPSVAIISLCSGIIIYVSMQIGVWISRFVDPSFAKTVGAVILMGIGLWAIYQMLTEKQDDEEPDAGKQPAAAGTAKDRSAGAAVATPKEIINIELKRLGLVIQILRTPSIADMDRSGNISPSEAMLLGTALSLDAFGAGIGAALLGFTPWLTAAVIALASGTFLSAGLSFGFRFANLKWIRKLSILPGFVLILMGIMKLF
ncbi:putative sporulation protein YtaF [Paenibacillus solanacearum]|uniref:Sporulation protein YtaF n=1 Tax=Paenibacillus solanacearum TaxID=2048548 RepID=A0A916K501_9BACL|nr:sporulation membrane protein YtaF [Paenibacillus solanacearum]CAG7644870.1 putative sporulation protein YtaF [Paenibacillus solanacearum]